MPLCFPPAHQASTPYLTAEWSEWVSSPPQLCARAFRALSRRLLFQPTQPWVSLHGVPSLQGSYTKLLSPFTPWVLGTFAIPKEPLPPTDHIQRRLMYASLENHHSHEPVTPPAFLPLRGPSPRGIGVEGGPESCPGTRAKTGSQEEDKLEIKEGWPLAKTPRQSGRKQPAYTT